MSARDYEGISIVAFPQKYNIDVDGGNPQQDYMQGVDFNNNPIKIKLPSNELLKNAKLRHAVDHVPTIARMAESPNRNSLYCAAYEDNSPVNMKSVLLFQKCYLGNDNVWIAGWGSVLKQDENSPDFEMGLGYMEVDPHYNKNDPAKNAQMKDGMDSYFAATAALQKNSNRINADQKKILNDVCDKSIKSMLEIANFKFRTVLMHPDRGTKIDINSIQGVRRELVSQSGTFNSQGRYGGAWVRVNDPNGNLVPSASTKIAVRYSKNKDYTQSTHAAVGTYFSKEGAALKNMVNNGYTAEIIPIEQINAGPGGNETYRDPAQLKAVLNTYFDPRTGTPSVRHMVSRIALTLKEKNHLLSRAYATDAKIGHPLTIDFNGESSIPYKIEGIDMKALNEKPAKVAAKSYSTGQEGLVVGESYLVKDAIGNEFTAQCIEHDTTRVLAVNGMALPRNTEYAPIAKEPEHAPAQKLKNDAVPQ